MDHYSKMVNRAHNALALRAVRQTLRVLRRLLRILLRRPFIDVLLWIVVLYCIASLIGRFNQPQPLLYPEPPTLFEGR
jgi:hypothetical protein